MQSKRLIYFEEFDDPVTAIDREKQIKRWSRSEKLALIRTMNPSFKELSLEESACTGVTRRPTVVRLRAADGARSLRFGRDDRWEAPLITAIYPLAV